MPSFAYVDEVGADTMLWNENGSDNYVVGDYVPNNGHVIAIWQNPGGPPAGWYARFSHAYTYSGETPSPTCPEKYVECPPFKYSDFSGSFTQVLHFHVLEMGTGANAFIKISPEMAF